MGDLFQALQRAEQGLRSGALGLAALEQATADARELYERLLVLRHKAREGARRKEAPVHPQAPERPGSAPAPPVQPIRLDTRPADPRQTSLIEAIEATQDAPLPPAAAAQQAGAAAAPQRPQPAAVPVAATASAATLAEKLERAHIDDLGKAISLSHKFWFLAEIFGGDRNAYDQGIAEMNRCADLVAAKALLDTQLALLKKPADPEALETFYELLKRRFA
jgi:hypothetical protein